MITELYNQAIARKKEPKTGSYTNYLFDKGLDKILKSWRGSDRIHHCC